jgi:pyridoxamine 5'-phosphate oxidase
MAKSMFKSLDVDPDPFSQFRKWYSEHCESVTLYPEAVSLGTASASGRVSVRTVLLKGFDENGFVFFTNYNSRKGVQLGENGHAAMLCYWVESGRQVRIEGMTEKVTEEESEAYFRTRSRESRIGAWASEQSKIIPDRQYLDNRFEQYKSHFEGRDIVKPPHWGGFRLVPDYFEFWREGDHRLHDRIAYSRQHSGWTIERLAP